MRPGALRHRRIATRLVHRIWVRVLDVAEGTQPDQLAAEELRTLLARA